MFCSQSHRWLALCYFVHLLFLPSSPLHGQGADRTLLSEPVILSLDTWTEVKSLDNAKFIGAEREWIVVSIDPKRNQWKVSRQVANKGPGDDNGSQSAQHLQENVKIGDRIVRLEGRAAAPTSNPDAALSWLADNLTQDLCEACPEVAPFLGCISIEGDTKCFCDGSPTSNNLDGDASLEKKFDIRVELDPGGRYFSQANATRLEVLPGFTKQLKWTILPPAAGSPYPESYELVFEKAGGLYKPSVTGISLQPKEVKSKILRRTINLSKVEHPSEFSKDHFKTSFTVPDGFQVTNKDAFQLPLVWKDGLVCNNIDEQVIQAARSVEFRPHTESSWRVLLLAINLLIVIFGAVFFFRRHRQ